MMYGHLKRKKLEGNSEEGYNNDRLWSEVLVGTCEQLLLVKKFPLCLYCK